MAFAEKVDFESLCAATQPQARGPGVHSIRSHFLLLSAAQGNPMSVSVELTTDLPNGPYGMLAGGGMTAYIPPHGTMKDAWAACMKTMESMIAGHQGISAQVQSSQRRELTAALYKGGALSLEDPLAAQGVPSGSTIACTFDLHVDSVVTIERRGCAIA